MQDGECGQAGLCEGGYYFEVEVEGSSWQYDLYMAAFDLSEWVWNVVTVGLPTVVISTGLFKMLGERWIESHFQKQLQLLKHEQEKELENVRLQIQLMHGRVSKIHQREFEVLPKAWIMLQETYGTSGKILTSVKPSWPNISNLSEQRRVAYLKSTSLLQVLIDEVNESDDPQTSFEYVMTGHTLAEAKDKLRLLSNFLIENKIFMSEEVWKPFWEIGIAIQFALHQYEFGHEASDQESETDPWKAFARIAPSLPELEMAIQKRLHFGEA